MMHNDFSNISTDIERLREEVLSRVRTVRRVRNFMKSPMASASLALIFILVASVLVSFGDVVHNIMTQGAWSGRFSYTYTSIVHARIMVQILAFLTSISCLAMIAKILFKLRTPVSSIGSFLAEHSPLKLFRS